MATRTYINAILQLSDKATAPLRKFGRVAGSVFRQVKSVSDALSGVGRSLMRLAMPAVAAVGVLGTGLVRGVQNAREYANSIADLSARLGVSAKFLQEWQYFAKLNAATSEDVTSAVSTLSRQYGALQSGTGKLYSGLARISPAFLKQVKSAKSTEEAFELVVKALRKVEDPARRVYLAQLAFGESGTKLINVALQSQQALVALRQEAHQAGIVMSNETIQGAQTLGDELTRLKSVMGGVFNDVLAKLLPIITPLVQQVTEWVKANRALLNSKINEFLDRLNQTLREIDFKAVLDSLASFASGALNAAAALASLKKGVWLLAAGFVSGLIPNVLATLHALATLAASAGLFTPIGAALAAIAATSVLVYKNFDQIKQTGVAAWSAVRGALNQTGELFNEVLNSAADQAKSSFQRIQEFSVGAYQGIKQVWSGIASFFERIGTKISSALSKIPGLNALRSAFSAARHYLSSSPALNSNALLAAAPPAPVLPSGLNNATRLTRLDQTPSGLVTSREPAKAEVTVKFENLPSQASVTQPRISGGTELNLNTEYGFALGGAL